MEFSDKIESTSSTLLYISTLFFFFKEKLILTLAVPSFTSKKKLAFPDPLAQTLMISFILLYTKAELCAENISGFIEESAGSHR